RAPGQIHDNRPASLEGSEGAGQEAPEDEGLQRGDPVRVASRPVRERTLQRENATCAPLRRGTDGRRPRSFGRCSPPERSRSFPPTIRRTTTTDFTVRRLPWIRSTSGKPSPGSFFPV